MSHPDLLFQPPFGASVAPSRHAPSPPRSRFHLPHSQPTFSTPFLFVCVYAYPHRYIVQHTDLGGLHKDILGPDGIYTYGGLVTTLSCRSPHPLIHFVFTASLEGTLAMIFGNSCHHSPLSPLPRLSLSLARSPSLGVQHAYAQCC